MAIKVKDTEGVVHQLELGENLSLFDLIDDAGITIRGDCGGNCCCSSCHVYVRHHPDAKTNSLLIHREADETAMLEEATAPVISGSRLCCMIEVTKDLDGLEIELTDDTKMRIN